jgi:hypothetical protein
VLAGVLAVVVAVMVTRSGAIGGSRVAEKAPGAAPPASTPELATVPGSTGEAGAVRIAGVGMIRTDPGVMSAAVLTDRRVVEELTPVVHARLDRIDDDGLQRALRAAGEPAGIVRIGRRVMTETDFGEPVVEGI